MDLVTLTDHDSIGGLEPLRHHPDFFISEELTCRMPSGTEIHIGVYDVTERQHAEFQRRRNDLISLLMYLTEKRIFFVLNHAFSDLTGRRDPEDFWWFAEYFQAFETRNSLMPPVVNRSAEHFAIVERKSFIGGSDAHTIASAGTAFTEVHGARTKEEFFAGLRAGHGVPCGSAGTLPGRWLKLTRDIFLVTAGLMCEKPAAATLAPLALLIPAVMLVQTLHAACFAWWWGTRAERLRQVGQPGIAYETGLPGEALLWP